MKSKAYFEVLYLFWVVDSLRILEVPALFVLAYHWLPLTTIDLMKDNRNLKFEAYFEVLYLFWVVDSLIYNFKRLYLLSDMIGGPYQPLS